MAHCSAIRPLGGFTLAVAPVMAARTVLVSGQCFCDDRFPLVKFSRGTVEEPWSCFPHFLTHSATATGQQADSSFLG